MNRAAPIVPTYQAIASRFEKPLSHGSGIIFRINPAIYGRDEAPVVFANVMQLSGTFYFSGPTFPADGEQLMRRAVLAGKAAVAAHNNQQPGGQRIYTASSPAEALTLIWNLLAAHYGIKDAAAQVQQYELRQTTDRHQEEEDSQAALELAQLGTAVEGAQHKVSACQRNLDDTKRYARSNSKEARMEFPYANQQEQREKYCANAKQQVARAILLLTQAEQELAALEAGESPAAAVPVGNPSTDWIPDYPQAGDVGEVGDEHRDDEPTDDQNQDSTEYPEYPSDEQHDESQDEYPADVEAEALGDLYNSQWD